MKPEQITALAREYADGLKHLFPDMPEHTYRDKMAQARNVIRLIQRDYCLVEKEGLKKKYAELESEWMMAKGTDVYTALTKLEFFESLFPEIAKEVEDA